MADGHYHNPLSQAQDGFGDRIGRWNNEVEEARGGLRGEQLASQPRSQGSGLRQRFRHTRLTDGALGREVSHENYRGSSQVARTFRNLNGHEHVTQKIREHRDPSIHQVDTKSGIDKSRGVRFQTEHDVHFMSSKTPLKAPQEILENVVKAFIVALELQDKKLEAELRRRDMLVAMLSFFGVISMGASAVITWYTNPVRESGLPNTSAPSYNDLDPSPNGKVICQVLGYLTSGSTVLCLIAISRFYSIKLQKKRQEWTQQMVLWQSHKKKKAEAYSFWQSTLSWWWFLECFIHLVHPMPFMDGTSTFVSIRQKTIYSYLQLWMLLRFYVMGRVLHIMHPAYKKRFEILYNNEELAAMNFKMSWQLTMKLYLFNNTWLSMTFLTVLLFLVFGFALFIIERVEQPSTFGEMDKTLFYVFTTTTTIGYGRVTSKSKAGRILTFLMGCYGQVLLTFFTGVITNILEPSKEHELIKNYIDSTEAEHRYRIAAAMLIQSAWKSSTKYKLLKGLITHEQLAQARKLRKTTMVDVGKKQRSNSIYIEMKEKTDTYTADTDTISLGNSSSSPKTRSQSGKDTSSIGTGGWEKRRAKEEQKAELERAANIGTTARKYHGNAIITLDNKNDKRGRRVGLSGPFPVQKKTQFQMDMAIVNRLLNTHRKSYTSISLNAYGKNKDTLRDVVLRGTTRDEMPLHDYPTYIKRQKSKGCLPLYAAHHKNNFLFESIKRFRIRKRKLASTKMEPKDPVLDNEVQTVGSLLVDIEEHNEQHLQDVEAMGDRILFQLQAVRSAIEQKFGK